MDLENEQKEKKQKELNRKEMKQNRTEMEHFTAQGLDPLSGNIALTSDQQEAIKVEKGRQRVGSRGRAAAAKNKLPRGGGKTRKRKAHPSTKKHKKIKSIKNAHPPKSIRNIKRKGLVQENVNAFI